MVPVRSARSPLTFDYRLRGTGWAGGRLRAGKQQLRFDVSYMPGDALGDLAGALVELIDAYGEDQEVIDLTTGEGAVAPDDEQQFIWYGEPWGYEWSLRLAADLTLRVRVAAYANVEQSATTAPDAVFTAQCPLVAFVRAVVTAMRGLLTKHGLVGYRELWVTAEFPVARYLALKRFLQDAPGRRITRADKRRLRKRPLGEDLELLGDV
jgi:hypothetical protein